MLDVIMIFLGQFILVGLLGIQQMNVQGRHYIAAAITSLILGISAFHVTAIIAEAGKAGVFSAEYFAYLLAGPLAICTAIWSFPKIKRYWSKNEQNDSPMGGK